MITVYRWLLCLYPRSYRNDFGDEMTLLFRDAGNALPPALAAKVSFYGREFSGLLSGALRARFDRLFGPATPSGRFDIQAHSRFRLSTVFLMLAMFAGVVLAIDKAQNVVQMKESLPATATAWGPMLWGLLVALALILAALVAAAAWGFLFALRRTGMHRLHGAQTWTDHR